MISADGRTNQIRVHLQCMCFPVRRITLDGERIDDGEGTLSRMMSEFGEAKCLECEHVKLQIKGERGDPLRRTRGFGCTRIWLHADLAARLVVCV